MPKIVEHGVSLYWIGVGVDDNGKINFSHVPNGVTTQERPSEMLAEVMSQIGYGVLRLDQSVTAIAHRLLTATEAPEIHQSVETIVQGKGSTPNADARQVYGHPIHLEGADDELTRVALGFLGSGRYKNHRAQRTEPYGKESEKGLLSAIEVLHGPVMMQGGQLVQNMGNQGYTYIEAPTDPETYRRMHDQLAAGRFTAEGTDDNARFLRIEGFEEPVSLNAITTNKLVPALDMQNAHTFQDNSIAVSYNKGEPKPIGFILSPSGQLVDPEITHGLMIMDIIRRGHYFEKSEAEQAKLANRFFRYTENTRVSQSMVYNGTMAIIDELAAQHGYEPLTELEASLARIKKQLNDPKLGFLANYLAIGDVASQMCHTLALSEASLGADLTAGRVEMPERYVMPYDDERNVYRANAYTFDLRRPDGVLLLDLKPGEKLQVSEDATGDMFSRKASVIVPGEMAAPDLSNGRDAAALLATGLIVTEQVLMETMARAITEPSNDPVAYLFALLGKEGAYEAMVDTARHIPPHRIGRQFPESQQLLQQLREALELQPLIDNLHALRTENAVQPGALDHTAAIHPALAHMKLAAQLFEIIPGLSSAPEGSRGLEGGLDTVMNVLSPRLNAAIAELPASRQIAAVAQMHTALEQSET